MAYKATLYDNILHLSSDNHYWMMSALMRIGYDHKLFQKIPPSEFSIEAFMDYYVKHNDKFDYFEKWAGFLITDATMVFFYKQFVNDLRHKEAEIFDTLDLAIPQWKKSDFCLICTSKGSKEACSLKHEFSHAFYYLNKEYKHNINKLIEKCSCKKSIQNKLKKWGYDDDSLKDEMQAYLCSSSDKDLLNDFSLRNPYQTAEPFRRIFRKYHSEYKKCQTLIK